MWHASLSPPSVPYRDAYACAHALCAGDDDDETAHTVYHSRDSPDRRHPGLHYRHCCATFPLTSSESGRHRDCKNVQHDNASTFPTWAAWRAACASHKYVVVVLVASPLSHRWHCDTAELCLLWPDLRYLCPRIRCAGSCNVAAVVLPDDPCCCFAAVQ